MSVIIKCPSCDKKLKMKEPTPGKKVRCPSCKEPFVPVAAAGAKPARQAGPKKKKRPAPVDDEFEDDSYGDDDYGDDDYEDEPQPKRTAAKGRQKASAKKKKAPAQTKSKAPLLIGVSVLAVGLAAGLTYALWPDGEEAAGAGGGSAVVDNTGNNNSDEGSDAAAMNPEVGDGSSPAMAANMGMGSEAGMGAGNDMNSGPSGQGASEPSYSDGSGSPAVSTPPVAAAGFSDFDSTPSASQPTSSVPVTTNYSQEGPVDLSYLPSKAEAVAKLDVGRLLEGPLGQLLQMPQVSPQVQQFEQMLGMRPQDIESVTIGVGGLTDAIASGKEPDPSQLPLTAVIRTKVALDSTKLQTMIPGGESITEGSMTYVRIPNPKMAGGVWFVDSNTVVVGSEPSVKEVGTNPAMPSYVDAGLMDGTSPIQVLYSPTNPDAVFRHPQAKIPPQVPIPPAAMAVAQNFLANANGVFIGLDLTNDLGVNLSVRCKDSGSATQMVSDMNAATEESKAAQANQPANPMMMPFMNIQKAMEESLTMEASGDIFRSTQSAKGGGQQLGAFIPMAMAMVGPAIQQAQQAAKRTQSKNNLKMIGLAMHNFHSIYGRFPNSASVDGNGKPLLSWRIHLLPFLGHEDLYKQFALDEPWDSPTNMPLVAMMPDVYKSPQVASEPGKTIYIVPVGLGTAFEMQKGRGMREFTDGTSNTILLLEGAEESAVVWTQPADLLFDPLDPKRGVRNSPAGFQVVFADGSAQFISNQASDLTLKGMFTRNGAD